MRRSRILINTRLYPAELQTDMGDPIPGCFAAFLQGLLDDDALKSALKIVDFVKSVGRVSKLIKLEGKDPNVLGFEKTISQIRDTDSLDFMGEMRIRLGL